MNLRRCIKNILEVMKMFQRGVAIQNQWVIECTNIFTQGDILFSKGPVTLLHLV